MIEQITNRLGAKKQSEILEEDEEEPTKVGADEILNSEDNDETDPAEETHFTDPDIDEFGLDLKKIREVEQMFKIKQMNKGLTQQEKQLKYEIETKRAMYQMDRFVSISEVHIIVKDSLMELYDKLAASHRLAKQNQIEIARMDTVVKKCTQAVRSLEKLGNGVTMLYRQMKEQTIKIVDIQHKVKDN